ncbi:hypothetical protein, partial [Nocardioides cremeus]|uniref:hypothetical protein n=1 Tax=Nocardioides cremeus TaxID=3058044 RepID=UPI003F6BBD21
MAEALNSLFKTECIRNPVMRPKGGWKTSATSRSRSPNTSTGHDMQVIRSRVVRTREEGCRIDRGLLHGLHAVSAAHTSSG